MIHVDRSSVPVPELFLSEELDRLRWEAGEHFRTADPAKEQRKFRFDVHVFRTVKPQLLALFHRKCAFCETPVAASGPGHVHHFRPRQEAVDDDGRVSRPHYWWLAYDWQNLYLSCQRCERASGARFPVRRRAREGTPIHEIVGYEEAMLLDPCADHPDEHLVFAEDGLVAARTERGETTIDVFRLNRGDLIATRRAEIADTFSSLRGRPESATTSDLRRLLALSRPYAGAVRQVALREGEQRTDLSMTLLQAALPEVPYVSHLDEVRAVEHEEQRKSVVRPLGVEHITITNFKGIEHLALDFADQGDDAIASWRMLLGENGRGKSSVLQALALVVMGAEARERLGLPAAGLVRHGADFAEIEVHVRDAVRPRTLHISPDRGFEADGPDLPGAIAAYGASRIPPARSETRVPRRYRTRPRVESLFDPRARLVPFTPWLLELEDDAFNYAARAVVSLLYQEDGAYLSRGGSTVELLRPGQPPVSIEQLSDGYRSMVAIAVDLMHFFMTRYGSMDAAEGLVLVDEIGAHLHPQWQMRVVRAFRQAFPRLQFVATTHDPLCLRGMEDGEVVVLQQTRKRQVYALDPDEVPSVKGLEVDALLRSDVFGLGSTIDPEVDARFAKYYELLATDRRTPAVERDIELLREELEPFRRRGVTEREQMICDVMDEYVARARDRSELGDRMELSRRTRDRLREILENGLLPE